MKMKKLLGLLLVTAMAVSTVGCGAEKKQEVTQKESETKNEVSVETSEATEEKEAEPEPVTIKVDRMPDKDKSPEKYESMVKQVAAFEELYPWITIEWDTSVYSVDTFMAKAATGQLPDIMYIPATEANKIVSAGYAQDITAMMEKYGYTEAVKADVLDAFTYDEKIYFIPYSSYTMGLVMNKAVLEEAGELNADGSVNYPETWEELAEMAGRIKEKTGKAGLALPTTGNCGGWHFMNIAWSYGVDFMAQDEDGKWVTQFNTPECVEALQFVSDLKWKYDALSDNEFIDYAEMYKLTGSGQAAMVMSTPDTGCMNDLGANGMVAEEFAIGHLPAGPEGRYALSGGSLFMIPAGTSEEKQDACFKWTEFIGEGVSMTEEALESQRAALEDRVAKGSMVLPKVLASSYNDGQRAEALNKLYGEYADVKPEQVAAFEESGVVTVRMEEPQCCQDLYAIFDNLVQAVLTDENADIESLVEKAANDFQVNFLDNVQ